MGYDLWMKLIFVHFRRIWFEMKSLFFSLMKRTKNQGFGIVVKAQYSDFLKIFASRRFILFAPETLIFSVICCAASDKSLAFQFTLKTQQSQGQRWFWIEIWDLYMKLIFVYFKRFWFEIFVLFLDLIVNRQ